MPRNLDFILFVIGNQIGVILRTLIYEFLSAQDDRKFNTIFIMHF